MTSGSMTVVPIAVFQAACPSCQGGPPGSGSARGATVAGSRPLRLDLRTVTTGRAEPFDRAAFYDDDER